MRARTGTLIGKQLGLRAAALLALLAIAFGALAACSSDDDQEQPAAAATPAEQQDQQEQPAAQPEPQPEPQQQEQPAAQPEPQQQQQEQPAAQPEPQQQQDQPAQQEDDSRKEPIIFSNLNWTSAEVQNQIVSYIVNNGYGYPVDLIDGDTVSLWQGLLNGDTHVTMEIWPAQQQWIDELEDDTVITLLGDSLDENWEGWVIPQYVKDENPGLVSVTDIPDYAELFVTADSRGRARFISCIAGWACEQVNEEKFDSYGLRDSLYIVDPGSGAALFADLEASYDRGDAWLGYIWGPTKPTATLDLYRLEEPEWTQECWDSGKACAYPASAVRIAVASELVDRAPDVVEFLRAWDFKANEQVGTDIWMSDNDETPEAAAIYYLRTYRDVWTAFVPDDVAAKVDAALADAS